jgi:hypothetical protein
VYVLPNRSTYGQLQKGMNPQFMIKLSTQLLTLHVSFHRLSKSYGSFVHHISSISVPNKVQEALKDP